MTPWATQTKNKKMHHHGLRRDGDIPYPGQGGGKEQPQGTLVQYLNGGRQSGKGGGRRALQKRVIIMRDLKSKS